MIVAWISPWTIAWLCVATITMIVCCTPVSGCIAYLIARVCGYGKHHDE